MACQVIPKLIPVVMEIRMHGVCVCVCVHMCVCVPSTETALPPGTHTAAGPEGALALCSGQELGEAPHSLSPWAQRHMGWGGSHLLKQ